MDLAMAKTAPLLLKRPAGASGSAETHRYRLV